MGILFSENLSAMVEQTRVYFCQTLSWPCIKWQLEYLLSNFDLYCLTFTFTEYFDLYKLFAIFWADDIISVLLLEWCRSFALEWQYS